MADVEVKRKGWKGEATRVALIEAAESLIARVGVDGASIRRIGSAIGSLNANVVAYHFGSKDALIEAIYRYRLPAIDLRRGELMAEAEGADAVIGVPVLMRILAQPLLEQTDSTGRHSFAGFLAGIERSGLIAARGALGAEFPHSAKVIACLEALPCGEKSDYLHKRLRLATSLITTALRLIDDDAEDNDAEATRQFEEALAVSIAIVAPSPTIGGV